VFTLGQQLVATDAFFLAKTHTNTMDECFLMVRMPVHLQRRLRECVSLIRSFHDDFEYALDPFEEPSVQEEGKEPSSWLTAKTQNDIRWVLISLEGRALNLKEGALQLAQDGPVEPTIRKAILDQTNGLGVEFDLTVQDWQERLVNKRSSSRRQSDIKGYRITELFASCGMPIDEQQYRRTELVMREPPRLLGQTLGMGNKHAP
jgi:hypothetical protein